VTSPQVAHAIARLKTLALNSGYVHEPINIDVNPAHTVARVAMPLNGKGTDEASRASLRALRDSIIPRSLGGVAEASVTGPTAYSVDFNKALHSRQPLVFAFVLALAFLLLLWNFRSIVIPTTAILLNLLSVGAAYGVLVSVFQGGWGIIHVEGVRHGPIVAWLPLFLFVILFGLSMDYHVFILSRIREGRDRGLGTTEAIRIGITRSAGVVTSAAVVMVAVFSTFATLSVTSMKQLGIGLAVAILVDATIIRGLLLPAAMQLLGDRNWYLPKWISRLLPQTHSEEETDRAIPAPARAA
jgi:RND superfamily putative drug exporter